jgi:hypothetical protein
MNRMSSHWTIRLTVPRCAGNPTAGNATYMSEGKIERHPQ